MKKYLFGVAAVCLIIMIFAYKTQLNKPDEVIEWYDPELVIVNEEIKVK